MTSPDRRSDASAAANAATLTPVGEVIVGAPAPPIELHDSHGEWWQLSDRIGHAVVLIFHRHIH